VCRRDQLVRHVPVASAAQLLTVQPPLRILGVVSSPRGLALLDVEKEQEQLTRALAWPRSKGLVDVRWAPDATWATLQDMLLSEEWHAVHFIGHGGFETGRDEGVLALTRDDGRADWVYADRLVDLLHQARPMPRLVVLNSCSGAVTGVNDLFAGTAAALVRGGVSAVAAMQYSISDAAAVAFARGFYTAISHGRGVDDATSSGRVAILGTGAQTLEWVTPVMYLRGHDSRLFILPARPSCAAAEFKPRDQAGVVSPDRAHADGWTWERYRTELRIPADRIEVGRRLVAAVVAALQERGLLWRQAMRKGYVAFQRTGGYNVIVIDLWWNRVPRLAGKIPAEPAALGLASPYPHLPDVWIQAEHEWGWTVAPGTPLPEVGMLIDLIRSFQPATGPMATAIGASITVASNNEPDANNSHEDMFPDDVLESAIERLESSGVSRNVREAAESLRVMGYELKLATTTVPGKRPENYLRIIDPGYTAHGVGYLTPSLFAFSRGSDRERLASLPGAMLTGSAITFSHAENVQLGLAAARLIKRPGR
jgi:hypothetical protein